MLPELGSRACQEVPVAQVLEALLVIEGQEVGSRPVDGVGDNRNELNPLERGAEHLVCRTELLGDDRAVRYADGVEESKGDRLAAQAPQARRNGRVG